MRIATWNINSVRLRLPQVLRFIKEQNIDVMCLQETKTPDEYFPCEDFKSIGFINNRNPIIKIKLLSKGFKNPITVNTSATKFVTNDLLMGNILQLNFKNKYY